MCRRSLHFGGWSVVCLGFWGIPCSASDEAAQGYEGMKKHSEGSPFIPHTPADRNPGHGLRTPSIGTRVLSSVSAFR
eukprot:5678198-Prymnesium_polylepis.1